MRAAAALLTLFACTPFTAPGPSGAQAQPQQPEEANDRPPGAGEPPTGRGSPRNGDLESLQADVGENPDPPPPGQDRSFQPPPAPPQPQDAPKPAPPAKTGLPADAQTMVDEHNARRAKHCAPALAWSPKLASVAQDWANHLRDSDCAFEHSRGKYGENLAAGSTGYMDPPAVVAMWYDEIKDYAFDKPGFSMTTGHFTQVVWKGTTQVGCGKSQCKGMDVWVCEYDPPGNWEGQYKQNVLPLGCK